MTNLTGHAPYTPVKVTSGTPMPRVTYSWGIYGPDGALAHIGTYKDESDAWEVYLGWPTPSEIEDRKREGFKAVKVAIAPL